MIEIIIVLIHFAVLIIGIYKIIKFFKNRALPSIKRRKKIEREKRERIEGERIEGERIEGERIEGERIEGERIEGERIEREKQKIDDAKAMASETQVNVSANTKGGALPKGFEPKPEPTPMSMPEYLIPITDTAYVEEREKQKKEKIERELIEKERIEREQLERERIEREPLERERIEKERIEMERIEGERIKRKRFERKHEHNEKTFLSTSELLDRIKNKKEFDKDRKFVYSLFHLTHIDNLEDILSNGILSHDLAMSKNPKRISNNEIVKRRSVKHVSPEHTLSYYANFYFNVSNPMLYLTLQELGKELSKNIIVFEIDYPLSDFEDVIYVSDGNCANNDTRIESILKSKDTDANPTRSIWGFINYILTVSSWKDKDEDKEDEKKRRIMAECLIPKKVDIPFIHTIHVRNNDIEEKINRIILDNSPNFKNIKVKQTPEMFFSNWGL